MKKMIVGALLGVWLGLVLLWFGSPQPLAAWRGHRTFTPIVSTIVPGATGTLPTKTPTAQWTPIVSTIVPGPTGMLPTKTPVSICSRNKCP